MNQGPQRQSMLRSVGRGFAAGIVVGLLLSVVVALFTAPQPPLWTSVVSIFTAALYGAYLGLIYGSQPGESRPTAIPITISDR